MQDIAAELQPNDLFRGIAAEDIRTLLRCLHPVRRAYDKGALIWREGERTHAAGLVLHGRVQILRDDFWGNRSILGEAGAGDLFGEVYACTPDARLTVSVLAAAACEVLFVEIEQLLTACSRSCRTGRAPADWEASTISGTPRSRQRAAISSMGRI